MKLNRRNFVRGIGLAGLGVSTGAVAELATITGSGNLDSYRYTREPRGSIYRKVLPTTFYKVIENRPGYIGTIKVVGKINQIDSREHGFAELVYHASRQDWSGEWGQAIKEAIDERNKIWGKQTPQQREDRMWGNAIVMASDQFHVNFGDAGSWRPIAPTRDKLILPPEEMSAKIKQVVKWYGAVQVGICEITEDMRPFFYSVGRTKGTLRGGSADYSDEGRAIPWPYPHKYCISIGVFEDLSSAKGLVGPLNNTSVATECGDDDVYPLWLESVIRGLGYDATAHFIAKEDFIQPAFGVKAGLGELGRLGQLVSPWGANIRLAAVTTNMPLATDKPIDFGLQDFCKNCKKCADNCPAKALSTKDEPSEVNGLLKYAFDPIKCTKQRTTFGCAACAAVCPFSKPDSTLHTLGRIIARDKTGGKLLKKLDDFFYGEKPAPREMGQWAPWRM
jgi:reductive dehalogenase